MTEKSVEFFIKNIQNETQHLEDKIQTAIKTMGTSRSLQFINLLDY